MRIATFELILFFRKLNISAFMDSYNKYIIFLVFTKPKQE